ncbi:MAG: site-specific DNA-methyltransferase [Gammaproteobacteria bacterium]|nr:site-specific DNA-methyltransferase [Gammaproteobacteria bacterium]MBU1724012.1 site-specific DNA-methyltransferase [Gammaproteobacteria bacterium]MBU2006919.1 site-specific DNA-methyltransferase [Gammaproteobacteria bacterium]
MPLLDWLNKPDSLQTASRVPYRLLEAVPELSYGAPNHNLLIQGDNLEALKALLPLYAGRVKCVYIDPPYNTRSAFEHYDDNLEHSQWLSMMYPRLELLRDLLAEDGSIWVSIDDNEGHYLKVMLDEIFGRKNFIANVVWQKAYGPRSNAFLMSDSHEHVLVYGMKKENLVFGLLERSKEQTSKYRNPDNDPRGMWKPENSSISLLSGQRGKQFAKTGQSDNIFEIISPTGIRHLPPKNRCWAFSPVKYQELLADNRIFFGDDGSRRPAIKRFLSEIAQGVIPQSMWLHEDVGHNQEASREIQDLFGDAPFSTPKPERLIERILHIATNPGDLVLDSFLGSGTTAAVAHKMGRSYIGVEMGGHAVTHCQPRLQKVVDGEQGGISKAVNWQGGGGFTFCRLGATVFDEFGMIDKAIRFPTLAAYIWYLETRTPWITPQTLSPLLGIHEGTAYYLLYNGILGDRRPQGGNVLTQNVLDGLPKHDGKRVIYGETSRFGAGRLAAEGIVFKQIPYDVRVG